MESDKIKHIWKNNIEQKIESYSDSEIESIVLKSARKAIGVSYPGVLHTSLLVAIMLFCLWIGIKYTSPQMHVFWIVCIAITLGAICVSIYSRRKMQKYSVDMPLKEWVESRIREFDRSINLKKRYWFTITYGTGFLVLLTTCVMLMLTSGFTFKRIIIPFAVGFVFLVVFIEISRRMALKRMAETRKQLQKLYDQLDELNDK